MLSTVLKWTPKSPHFLFCCSFYKRRQISIKFGTQYIEEICNTTIIDKSTSPIYRCYIPWGNLICGFRTILADLLRQNAVKSTSKLEDKIRPMTDFRCCILLRCCADARDVVTHLCHCHDNDILQQDSMPTQSGWELPGGWGVRPPQFTVPAPH